MKLNLTWEQVFTKGAYLANVKEWREYEEGKPTGRQLGQTYVLVNRNGFDKINVKVREKKPIITQEEIEASEKDIPVIAKGFVGKIYNLDGRVAVSGEAEEVTLI